MQATPPTVQPTATAIPLPRAPIAAHLTYTYVSNNDVWVSINGASPRQITHLGLAGTYIWNLVVSADHSLVLAVGEATGGASTHAWLITLPADVVTMINIGNISQINSAASLAVDCTSNSDQRFIQACRIIADRYLVGCSLYHSAHVISCVDLDLRTGRLLPLPSALGALTAAEITSAPSIIQRSFPRRTLQPLFSHSRSTAMISPPARQRRSIALSTQRQMRGVSRRARSKSSDADRAAQRSVIMLACSRRFLSFRRSQGRWPPASRQMAAWRP